MKSDIKERIEKLNRGQVPEGYKKIQGQIMPDSWNIYKLEEVIASSDYGTSEQTNDTKGYPVLRMGNLVDGKISSENLVYVDLDRESFNNLKLEKGDLLFNRTNSYDLVGKVSLFDLDGDYTFASYLIRLKVINSKVLPKYLNYYMNLNSSQKQIKTFSTKGVQQVNVNITTLKKFFKVKLPSNIFEQQKIVDILSTWDKAIELKEKLIEQKKEQKKGLMQRLLTGKVRLPGFKGEWVKVEFGKVMKFPKKKPVDKPEDYYLLTVKLHLKGIEATNKKPNVTSKGRPYFLREPGELLIGRQNFHNGGIGIVPEGMTGYVASNAISSIVAIKGNIKFYYYLNFRSLKSCLNA